MFDKVYLRERNFISKSLNAKNIVDQPWLIYYVKESRYELPKNPTVQNQSQT